MKKLVIPLIVILYMLVACLCLIAATTKMIFVYAFYVLGMLAFALIVMNIINALLGNYNNENIYKETLIYKIVLIPFYIFNFVVGILVAFVAVFAALSVWFFIAAIPLVLISIIMIIFTYLLMISLGSYNIVTLIKRIRRGESRDIKLDILTLVLHFIFVVDVLGAIVLYKNEKNNGGNYEKR